MNLWNETKSVPISRQMIWGAYKKVKANRGASGVERVSMEQFDANRSKHLYKLWNRMASGSYFPPPVKEVEIPKKDGKTRKLGIPTISDRIGQTVVKEYLEPRFEKIFSENWCIIYIKRWLQMPMQKKTGELEQKQGIGTPQGGVISPLLANLFLHYAMDKWLELRHSGVNYVRYADDAIIHCRSRTQAEQVLQALNRRMGRCGLELHPVKTKLVYCRDYRRQDGRAEH